MNDHEDQLRAAFGTHEQDTPDPVAVYARVTELSQTYKRRRRGAQLAAGSVLGAGLIVGAFQVPAMFGSSANTSGTSMVAPAAPASASPVPSASATGQTPAQKAIQAAADEKLYDAYFNAGYGGTEAVELAKIWKMDQDDLGAVKSEAGQRLLAGKTLPVAPDPANVEANKDSAAYDAYFTAGYDYDDAVAFAKLWKIDDPSDAKVAAGKKLLAGDELPIRADPVEQTSEEDSANANAFFAGGYDVDDAVELAKIWKLPSAWDAKVAGGEKLLAGQALPFNP